MSTIAYLPERGVVELAGADRVGFLQGLVSNDVAEAAPGVALWAALLTPQGKWLADFFILAEPDRLLLDCERAQAAMLVKHLSRYRLRAAVTLRDVSEAFAVHAAWGAAPDAPGIVAADPRLPEAGWRILAPAPITGALNAAAWQAHRLALGLPDGTHDMDERSVLLEAGFDELGGVSWTKGCYMGQELTARTKYRGLVKRRLVPVTVTGPMPAPGTPVLREGQEVGMLRFGLDGRAMALLRLEALAEGPALQCGNAILTVAQPSWMKLPVSA
jgi:folate-binding protein YgfZ